VADESLYFLVEPQDSEVDLEDSAQAAVNILCGPSTFWNTLRAFLAHYYGYLPGKVNPMVAAKVVPEEEADCAIVNAAGTRGDFVQLPITDGQHVSFWLKKCRIESTIEFKLG
jgi:hypothetical protein